MADSILGRVVWHELMTTDPASAGAFFSAVIGWTLQPWGEKHSYTMLMAGKVGMGGLMALPGPDTPASWLTYVASPDIEATVAKATALGATVLNPITPIPTVGRFAVLQDPQGAVFAVLTPDRGPASPAGPPPVRDFSWHELPTTDAAAAMTFYQQLFGWEPTGVMDMGAMGQYHMFGLDGRAMGGMFDKPAQVPGPPAWLAYIRVPDARASADAIVEAGGTVINGPMQVPGGDWILQALDPQGVMFAVHSAAADAAPATRPRATKRTGGAGRAKHASAPDAARTTTKASSPKAAPRAAKKAAKPGKPTTTRTAKKTGAAKPVSKAAPRVRGVARATTKTTGEAKSKVAKSKAPRSTSVARTTTNAVKATGVAKSNAAVKNRARRKNPVTKPAAKSGTTRKTAKKRAVTRPVGKTTKAAKKTAKKTARGARSRKASSAPATRRAPAASKGRAARRSRR